MQLIDMPNNFNSLPNPVRISEQDWPDGTVALVTIRCITYNHVNFIRDAIEGFLMQETTFPVEILIHDDASTDGTADIVRDYEARYPRLIRAIYQTTNQFSQGKRVSDYLQEIQKGKYIALCEGDDYWVDKNKLQKQAEFLEYNPDVAITYTNCQPFNQYGLLDIDLGGSRRDLTAGELLRSEAIFTLTVMYRNIIKFPPEFSIVGYGDKSTWSLLGEFGAGKYLGDIKPSMYRIHEGGIHSAATSESKRLMRLRTFSGQMAYFERVGKSDIARYYRGRMLSELMLIEGIHPRILPYVRWVSSVLKALSVLGRHLKKLVLA